MNGHFFEDKADGNVEFEDKSGNIFTTEATDTKIQSKISAASKSITSKKKSNAESSMASNTERGGNSEFLPGMFVNGKLYK